jgi:hypothetical protein
VVVSIKGVGLDQADIAGQVALRMLSSPVARVIEQGRRRILAAKRPVVPYIGPDPTEDSLQFCQHRHRRIVGVDAFRPHDMGTNRLNNRVERHYAGADPIRQCRDTVSRQMSP